MAEDTPTPAIGRPSDYTTDLAELICDRIAAGESLRGICTDEKMPDKSTVLRWLRKEQAFRTQYAQAREIQADEFLEQLTEIAEDDSNDTQPGAFGQVGNAAAVARAKLQIDTLKWRMSKQAPKVYGDKLDLTSGDKPLGTKTIIKIGGKRPKPDADASADT